MATSTTRKAGKVTTTRKGAANAPLGKGKVTSVSLASQGAAFKSDREWSQAMTEANRSTAHAVRSFVMRSHAYMDANGIAIRSAETRLAGAIEGTIKVTDVQYFALAAFIYSFSGGTDPLHIMKAEPRKVLTMSNRIARQYGLKDGGALDKVRELVAAELPFHKWDDAKYADGTPMVRALNAKKDDGTKPKADKGKGDDKGKPEGVKVEQPKTFDEFVVAAARWLHTNKDRNLSDPSGDAWKILCNNIAAAQKAAKAKASV